MTNKIKELIILTAKEEIETNPRFEPYRRELTFDSINYVCLGRLLFNVVFRFKPIGRGRKDNRIRLAICIDKEFNEKIVFVQT